MAVRYWHRLATMGTVGTLQRVKMLLVVPDVLYQNDKLRAVSDKSKRQIVVRQTLPSACLLLVSQTTFGKIVLLGYLGMSQRAPVGSCYDHRALWH